jgi:hypothetical protein
VKRGRVRGVRGERVDGGSPLGRPSLPVGERERRQAYLAPLFVYLAAHHYVPSYVARDAGRRHGMELTVQRLSIIKRASAVIPDWLVAECCAVIGRSVAEVMGEEWVRQFGEDGRGGTEIAPVSSEPRVNGRPIVSSMIAGLSAVGVAAGESVDAA